MKKLASHSALAVGLAAGLASITCCAKPLPAPVQPLVATPHAELRAQPTASSALPVPALVWQSSRLANGLEVRSVSWPGAREASVAFASLRGGSDDMSVTGWHESTLVTAALVLQPLAQASAPDGVWGAHSTDIVFQDRAFPNGNALHADVPVGYVGLAVEQLAQRVRAPVLNESALARATRAIAGWRQHQGQALYPRATARALAALYGDEYAPGQVLPDDRKPPPQVSVQALKDAHQNRFVPGAGALVVVSPHSHEEVVALAERFFGGWTADGTPLMGPAPPSPREGGERFVFLDEQIADVRAVIVVHTPGWSSSSAPAFRLAATVLAGGRGSRLYRGLDELGIPYALSVEYHSGAHAGQLVVQLTAPRDRARKAVDLVQLEIFHLAKEPVSAAELNLAADQLRQVAARARETPRGVGCELEALAVMRASVEDVAARAAKQAELTPAGLRNAVAKTFVPQNLGAAIVGDLTGYGSLARWASGHSFE